MVDTPEITYPRTFTCHPMQNWTLGRSGFKFIRCIIIITNEAEYERFQLALSYVHPTYSGRVKEVTPEVLQIMLTGATALPQASKGTDSETAKAAMHAMRGQVAADQLRAKQEEEARALSDPKGLVAPVTATDLLGDKKVPVTAESMLA